MISIELLGKVLGCKIISIKFLHKDYIHFNQTENEIELQYINIYELNYKCREWANSKGYVIIQDTRGYTKVERILTKEKKIWEDEDMSKNIKRVIQSCEWIRTQIAS